MIPENKQGSDLLITNLLRNERNYVEKKVIGGKGIKMNAKRSSSIIRFDDDDDGRWEKWLKNDDVLRSFWWIFVNDCQLK